MRLYLHIYLRLRTVPLSTSFNLDVKMLFSTSFFRAPKAAAMAEIPNPRTANHLSMIGATRPMCNVTMKLYLHTTEINLRTRS